MDKIEYKIQEEIVRRALKLAETNEQESSNQIQTQCTIDALQELAGLPRAELEKIADEVRESYTQEKDNFLSIKNQIIITIIIVLAFCLLLKGMGIF